MLLVGLSPLAVSRPVLAYGPHSGDNAQARNHGIHTVRLSSHDSGCHTWEVLASAEGASQFWPRLSITDTFQSVVPLPGAPAHSHSRTRQARPLISSRRKG